MIWRNLPNKNHDYLVKQRTATGLRRKYRNKENLSQLPRKHRLTGQMGMQVKTVDAASYKKDSKICKILDWYLCRFSRAQYSLYKRRNASVLNNIASFSGRGLQQLANRFQSNWTGTDVPKRFRDLNAFSLLLEQSSKKQQSRDLPTGDFFW